MPWCGVSSQVSSPLGLGGKITYLLWQQPPADICPAAFPLFGIQMYEGLGYQWATALVGFVTLALMPFPYIFYRYGKRIRSRSRFATTS